MPREERVASGLKKNWKTIIHILTNIIEKPLRAIGSKVIKCQGIEEEEKTIQAVVNVEKKPKKKIRKKSQV